jgi:prepilin-type processing-associated H-X9-DG protein
MQGTGSWVWDTPPVVTTLLGKVGATRDQFYCPANPYQNIDILWNFTPNYRVIGYALALPGNPGLPATNVNSSLIPQQFVAGGTVSPAPIASQRVLTADATISSSGQNNPANVAGYNFTSIVGGAPMPHHTSHLIDKMPAGGNLGMLDGHVEWREFSKMLPRSLGGPVFWW